jgi:PleD family two-component response regulator
MYPTDTDTGDPSQAPNGRAESEAAPERMLALERAIAERDNELAWTNERLIAEMHERSAAQASALAAERYDAATGLPNRRLFEEQLAQVAIDPRSSS